MQARNIAEFIDVLIIVPFLFAVSGKHNIQPNYLIVAGVLAFIAIAFRWYKNLEFHDRFLSALQVFIFTIIATLYLPLSLSIEEFAASRSLTAEQAYIILFYVILIIIGTYTTFWTKAGFIGIEGDPKVVRKDSLIVLACTITSVFGVILLPEFLVVWIGIIIILWRSILWFKRRT